MCAKLRCPSSAAKLFSQWGEGGGVRSLSLAEIGLKSSKLLTTVAAQGKKIKNTNINIQKLEYKLPI